MKVVRASPLGNIRAESNFQRAGGCHEKHSDVADAFPLLTLAFPLMTGWQVWGGAMNVRRRSIQTALSDECGTVCPAMVADADKPQIQS